MKGIPVADEYPTKYDRLLCGGIWCIIQLDTIAVRKMVGGFLKLIYPDGEFTKEELEEILQLSLEMRRRDRGIGFCIFHTEIKRRNI